MAVQYNPDLIQAFANKLYAQARVVEFLYTLLGALLGAASGYLLARFWLDNQSLGLSTAGGAVILGLLGFFSGQSRSFQLRLKAQQALCLMKIERNTYRDSI